MVQKRTERVARTREKILASAEKLFNANGVRLTGVDAISADAGLTKVTLYKHFPSKDELLAEVLRRREKSWREWFETSIAARANTPREQLLAVFDVLGEWFQTEDFRGSIFINISVENRSLEHPVHAVASDHMKKNRAYFRRLAEEAGISDPDIVESQFIVLFRGAIVTALVEHRMDAAVAARAAAARLIS